MNLPIEVLEYRPLRFKWRQTVATPVGPRVVEHEGALPPSIEDALISLITIARRLQLDNEKLRQINEGFTEEG